MARKIGILKEFLPALLPKYKIMLLEAFSPHDLLTAYIKNTLSGYPYHYIRLIVTGISDTKKALVFLKQHFGDSSFQQTKDRLKELPLLIYSGLDTGTAPLENSLDRWGLMYEKQQISLEKFLEDQAYIRNL